MLLLEQTDFYLKTGDLKTTAAFHESNIGHNRFCVKCIIFPEHNFRVGDHPLRMPLEDSALCVFTLVTVNLSPMKSPAWKTIEKVVKTEDRIGARRLDSQLLW